MKKFWLILYYGFARHLPDSYSRFWGSLSLKIRRLCCKHLFKMMGENVNIERGAWFGSGKDLEIGDNSGLGINCHVLNNTKIGKNVMMGLNCYMLESLHNYDRTDIPMTEQGFTTDHCQVISEMICELGVM